MPAVITWRSGQLCCQASAILPAVRKKLSTIGPLTASIVGAGNLGTALALTLPSAGCEVKFIATRAKNKSRASTKALARKLKARLIELGKEPLDSDLVWIAVPDDAIAQVAGKLANAQEWKGRIVV